MLQTWIDRIENITKCAGVIVSWLTLLMVLTTFLVVVLRYVFDYGLIAMQESITYMHACIFLVGAAYTLQQNAHVRVDIIYHKLSEKNRAWIDLLGTLFLLAPTMLFIFIISWEYVNDSWAVLETSREAGGLPGVFLLKSVILIMAALMLLQGIANILSSIQIIHRAKNNDHESQQPDVHI
jgi:TRAP-type mannitol/chloroaromatic compound transport system permease small subunit